MRTLVGSALVACIVVLAAMAWFDRAAPIAISVTPLAAEPMRVSVTGAVATPGIVTVDPGARLQDVANAAGGFTGDADVAALNMAGRVGDGEHIDVPRLTTADADVATSAPATDGNPLDLNHATASELEELPGIGEVLAARIVDYREEHGVFASIDELILVDGISPRLLEKLRPLITVTNGG
ncbi:MAG TPA: ComEA family DNA-binding protein [Thermomicrobiales bacterium]|nr:ComEA family DNA-binding protein [Thermomicrobiales bacterium]